MWKLLTLEQELLLLSVVDVRFISSDLITAFQGCSFVSFNMFSTLLDQLPAEYRGQVGYNALDDNSEYHPNIFHIPVDIHAYR